MRNGHGDCLSAYYNDNDPDACAWLRELIRRGLIAPGDVDNRSIRWVKADELKAYTQVHLFAGIGGWSAALRLAGWPDDRPVWTGSCPCQPFSTAGKRKAHTDKRHLWPLMCRLVAQCRPTPVFGEQVGGAEVVGTRDEAAFIAAVQAGRNREANRIAERIARRMRLGEEPETLARRWIDGVSADLAPHGYAMRFTVLGAHSVGSPHKRQRVWWHASAVPNTQRYPKDSRRTSGGPGKCDGAAEVGPHAESGRCCRAGVLPDTVCARRTPIGTIATGPIAPGGWDDYAVAWFRDPDDGPDIPRRIEPGLEPLAHGVPARVVRLRGYGGAIVPQVAAAWIKAVMT